MAKTQIKTPEDDEIRGQYASDWALDPGASFRDVTGTLDARGDGNTAFHHDILLFDHTDVTPDEASGNKLTETEGEEQHYRELGLNIGQLPVERTVRVDIAEDWLRKHDTNYNQKTWH